MAARSISTVTIFHLEFDDLAQSDDRALVGQMQLIVRSSKKRVFPKSVKYDRYAVSRGSTCLTIQLYMGDIETARFRFVLAPALHHE
jgi:hypothetical protein